MTHNIIEAAGLTGGYGANKVLRGASIQLPEGHICGVIGPNGAGKTTLLRALFGLLKLEQGTVKLWNEDISAHSPRDRLNAGIGYVAQERNTFLGLSVADNLSLASSTLPARHGSDGKADRLNFIFDMFPRLAERRDQKVGLMSGGEQRMVAISLGLVARPRVLLLDEPTTGLAPVIVQQLMEKIKLLNKQEGISTLIVEQNVLSLLDIVDSVTIVKDGRTHRFQGNPNELSEREIWEYM